MNDVTPGNDQRESIFCIHTQGTKNPSAVLKAEILVFMSDVFHSWHLNESGYHNSTFKSNEKFYFRFHGSLIFVSLFLLFVSKVDFNLRFFGPVSQVKFLFSVYKVYKTFLGFADHLSLEGSHFF